jgi:hypothetical protein
MVAELLPQTYEGAGVMAVVGHFRYSIFTAAV